MGGQLRREARAEGRRVGGGDERGGRVVVRGECFFFRFVDAFQTARRFRRRFVRAKRNRRASRRVPGSAPRRHHGDVSRGRRGGLLRNGEKGRDGVEARDSTNGARRARVRRGRRRAPGRRRRKKRLLSVSFPQTRRRRLRGLQPARRRRVRRGGHRPDRAWTRAGGRARD